MLVASISHFDPGCVKSPKFILLVELLPRFCRPENRPCWQRLSGTVQRENGSTHIQLVRLFTQPGPKAELVARPPPDGYPTSRLLSRGGKVLRIEFKDEQVDRSPVPAKSTLCIRKTLASIAPS